MGITQKYMLIRDIEPLDETASFVIPYMVDWINSTRRKDAHGRICTMDEYFSLLWRPCYDYSMTCPTPQTTPQVVE